LAPGGAYAPVDANGNPIQAPDMVFYNIDAAYDLAYSTVDAAFRFERDNRTLLWKVSPQIKHTLDSIRPQAVSANADYLRARAAYMANPTPAGLTALQTVLSKISQLATAAAAALPKG